MNRRKFITGLLMAPALVRASSLDALPRGVLLRPALPNPHVDVIQTITFQEISNGRWLDVSSSLLTADGRATFLGAEAGTAYRAVRAGVWDDIDMQQRLRYSAPSHSDSHPPPPECRQSRTA